LDGYQKKEYEFFNRDTRVAYNPDNRHIEYMQTIIDNETSVFFDADGTLNSATRDNKRVRVNEDLARSSALENFRQISEQATSPLKKTLAEKSVELLQNAKPG